MASIGIDIGSFSVKVAKVKASNRGYDLLHFSEYPLSQDPNKDNKIELVEILRDVEARLMEDGDQIVIGAHQFEVATRRRVFPFRERHKILKSLPFELEDDVPFSSENAIFDAKITHFVGNQAHVLAIACPTEHLTQVLRRSTDAGVEPSIVSVDGIGFANVFESWRESPWEYPASQQQIPEAAQTDLIINIGHRTTTIAVIMDEYVLDIRHIDWGGKDLADTIASKYSMPYLEALKELRRKAFILTNNEGATRDQVGMSEVVKNAVDIFANKLRLVLFELQNTHKIQFRQMILTGGVSQLRNLGPYLTQKTEIATNRLGKLDMLPSMDFATSPNGEITSVTAIGLAIEGIRRPKNPAVNLLKGDFARQSQTFQVLWDKWKPTAVAAGVVYLLLFGWSCMRVDFSNSNLVIIEDVFSTQAKNIIQGQPMAGWTRKAEEYVREQRAKEKTKQAFAQLKEINSSMDIVEKLSQIAPAKNMGGLNILELKVLGNEVVLVGEAANDSVIKTYRNSIGSALSTKIDDAPGAKAKKPGYKAFKWTFSAKRRGNI